MGRFAALLLLIFPCFAQPFNFAPGVSYLAQAGPLATATADFNGDGKLDLAVANVASSGISIYLGKGDGTFANPFPVTISGGCVADNLTVGDFNNDGNADLLIVCGFQRQLWVLPGVGNGTFRAPIASNLPGYDLYGLLDVFNFRGVAIADFNSDGSLDVVIGTVGSAVLNSVPAFTVYLLVGNGDGTFQSGTAIVPSGLSGTVILTADFNGDGKPDLVMDYYTTSAANELTGGGLTILLGNGNGTFKTGASYPTPGPPILGCITIADVNNDGKPDLIASTLAPSGAEAIRGTGASASFTVFTGNGDGTFTQSFNEAATNPTFFGMIAGNFRGTKTVDLIEQKIPFEIGNGLAAQSVFMTLRAGNGDGTFQQPVPLTMPSGIAPFWFSMAAADWNGDGVTDLAFTALPQSASLPGIDERIKGLTLTQSIQEYQALTVGSLVVMLNNLPVTAPIVAVSPRQLQFNAQPGGAVGTQSVTISNSGPGLAGWTATSSEPWLTVTPKSGSGAATLSVAVSTAGLGSSASATITIASTNAANGPQTISVSVTIGLGGTPVITSVVNGASFQPGIEAGSWVTIQGSNLSKTNPGRTWTASEIVNGNLPTQLDGTSVTIDGRSAFVYYISPTQINVQAPTDSATGPVAVAVTNNGQVSAPFTAQLQAQAPAFFLYTGTNYAIASHYPDYSLVGNPQSITGTVAAHPGDVLILWATGFGATNPATSSGVVVSGAPSVATLPTVTVGGSPVTVLSAVLSPGSVGLYQIAIQLPASVPTGVVAIQASAGTVNSPSGTTIFVQ
jgi:uncharacterized protein (TIGR03437 family)